MGSFFLSCLPSELMLFFFSFFSFLRHSYLIFPVPQTWISIVRSTHHPILLFIRNTCTPAHSRNYPIGQSCVRSGKSTKACKVQVESFRSFENSVSSNLMWTSNIEAETQNWKCLWCDWRMSKLVRADRKASVTTLKYPPFTNVVRRTAISTLHDSLDSDERNCSCDSIAFPIRPLIWR